MVLAITWLGTFTLIACVTFLILLTTDPQLPADRALFDSLSALTNAGLSTDAITLSPAGTYTLSLTMLVGRLMPLGLLWWLLLPAPATRR
jgi:Trk-type K+ transport system membrane component